MIDLIILNSKALVPKGAEVFSILKHFLSYTYSSCSIDKKRTNRENYGKPKSEKRNKYKWTHTEGHHIMDDGSPFYTIPRGLAELLPDEEFNKIYETNSELELPSEFEEDYIKYCLRDPKYILRDDQISAVERSFYYKRGINQMGTGSGKSIIACAIIRILINFNPNIRILLVSPVDHIKRGFADYFEKFGISYEYTWALSGRSNVTIASAIAMLNREIHLPSYHAVFYDECQHLQSSTWNELSMALVNAEFSIGFSAKVVEDSNCIDPDTRKLSQHEALAIGATGKVISWISASYLISEGILATPILISIKNLLDESLKDELDWHKCVKKGLMSEDRSDLVGRAISSFLEYGRRILILASTHEQSFQIAEKVLLHNPDISLGVSHGSNRGYSYKKIDGEIYRASIKGWEVIGDFKDKKISVLIGTPHLDEGADLPDLDVCVIAGAGKSARRIIQKVGRSLRISKTGKFAYLIDFSDRNSKILHKHYNDRLNTYISDIGISADRMYKEVEIHFIKEIFKKLEEID